MTAGIVATIEKRNGAAKWDNKINGYYDHDPDDNFKLDPLFLARYYGKKPNFGFHGLGEFVYYRTYSRLKDDGSKETFLDTATRVVEGCYEIQRRHCRRMHIPWDYDKALESAHEMFERMWDFKFLPPGRGLWMMGTKFMWERGAASLNNCAFCSSKDLDIDPAEPFCFLMDMTMLGVGVGFDTKGADKLLVKRPSQQAKTIHVVEDSREGWVESLRLLVLSYTSTPSLGEVEYSYEKVRPAGSPINGFGGKASGPGILMELHLCFKEVLSSIIGKLMSSVVIVDLMDIIGRCVVAGNVRRSALLALGESDDLPYYTMKNSTYYLTGEECTVFYSVTNKLYSEKKGTATLEDFAETNIDPDRLKRAIDTWNACNHHRWASNNSIYAKVGDNYEHIGSSIANNGEPGVLWLDNIRDFGRMADGRKPGIDGRVLGTNPCAEQSLESYELCCLCETFPSNHENAADYMRTLKFAYLYAKTVTLLPTHNSNTNRVMLRNRRIGLSQSGIINAFKKFGRRVVLSDFCDAGYNEVRRWDDIYSEWLCVQKSIKVSSVKPSGSVSLLVGVAPGIHHPEASTHWRRVRMSIDSPLVGILQRAGYEIEPAITDNERTVIVKFAIIDDLRPVSDVSLYEQALNAVQFQHYWADNSVSATLKFKPEEAKEIPRILECFEDQLKSISFLPYSSHGYIQAPYEACTVEEAQAYLAKLSEPDYTDYIYEGIGSKYCDNDSCVCTVN